MKLSCLVAVLLPVLVFAQNAPNGNMIKNGRFESFAPKDNLWNGVDGEGYLAGRTVEVEAVTEGGSAGRLRLPPSVQVADLNGDGLPDILMVDGFGYFRVYFNSGTKTEPKFTNCEMASLFIRRVRRGIVLVELGWSACLADLDKRGVMSLVLGDYIGRLLIVKNTGTAKVPEWRQPAKIDDVIVPTTKDNHLWANLLAPAVWDWNGDGRLDVLVGEGSYSANAIHLLLNKGTSSAPKFDEESHEYLAFGEGREQLVPAVVDWNGDGIPDLLVGDRLGNINLYLSKGPWKKGVQLDLQAEPVRFGAETNIGKGLQGARCVRPAVADLNGDGLFDIIIGETNGRIAVAYNIGTKTEPKFGPMVELKSASVPKQDFIPLQKQEGGAWEIRFGEEEGNFYGCYSSVSPSEDPEAAGANSSRVLRFAYSPSPNKIISRQPMVLPGWTGKNDMTECAASFRSDGTALVHMFGVDMSACDVDSNTAILRQHIEAGSLRPLTNFKLSFRVKGHGVKNGRLRFCMAGFLVHDTKKDGNAAGNWVTEVVTQDADFPVTPNWNVISKTINVRFQKEGDLNFPDKWKAGGRAEYRGMLEIRSILDPDAGAFYIDDVQLTPM